MYLRRINGILLGVMVMWSSVALSAVGTHYGAIEAVLSDNVNYGYCMLKVAWESPIDCPNNWVSMDCKGSYSPKENTRRLWDVALMAKATESPIYLVINDAKKHNGFCVVERLEIF